jgi:hypothetical protein
MPVTQGVFRKLDEEQKAMRQAILILCLGAVPLLLAFGWGGGLSSSDVEQFFRGHKVEGYYAVAIKKRTLGGVAYLSTVHGFPDNTSVCEELIAPYNKDRSLSAISGEYFCEELRWRTALCGELFERFHLAMKPKPAGACAKESPGNAVTRTRGYIVSARWRSGVALHGGSADTSL